MGRPPLTQSRTDQPGFRHVAHVSSSTAAAQKARASDTPAPASKLAGPDLFGTQDWSQAGSHIESGGGDSAWWKIPLQGQTHNTHCTLTPY